MSLISEKVSTWRIGDFLLKFFGTSQGTGSDSALGDSSLDGLAPCEELADPNERSSEQPSPLEGLLSRGLEGITRDAEIQANEAEVDSGGSASTESSKPGGREDGSMRQEPIAVDGWATYSRDLLPVGSENKSVALAQPESSDAELEFL